MPKGQPKDERKGEGMTAMETAEALASNRVTVDAMYARGDLELLSPGEPRPWHGKRFTLESVKRAAQARSESLEAEIKELQEKRAKVQEWLSQAN